jgi:orotate phosphoribosyltransferase
MLPREQYILQHAFATGDRVDAAIRIGERLVPVDAKFPLEGFRRILEETDEERRPALRRAFLRDVKNRVDEIAKKYILPDEGTFDFALTNVAILLGAELAGLLTPLLGGARPSAVVAPALGGVLVAHEVARGFSCRGLFTERQDGRMTLRRGFTMGSGEKVVVVEDVITTGGSTREVLECVRGLGAQVLAVGSLVDRSGGSVDLGLPLRSLLSLEVPAWEASSCPLCAAGGRPEKPGSRAKPAA